MLIVSHMDAVNASVTRYKPWALVYPVQHTGFTASYREKYDGARSATQTVLTGARRVRDALASSRASHDGICHPRCTWMRGGGAGLWQHA